MKPPPESSLPSGSGALLAHQTSQSAPKTGILRMTSRKKIGQNPVTLLSVEIRVPAQDRSRSRERAQAASASASASRRPNADSVGTSRVGSGRARAHS